jgi:hypothetical protein
LRHCFSTIETAVTGGITGQCNRARDSKFAIWTEFRQQYGKAEYLDGEENSLAWLLLFAYKVRCGELAYNGNPIRSRSVEEYVLAVASAHILAQQPDPVILLRQAARELPQYNALPSSSSPTPYAWLC